MTNQDPIQEALQTIQEIGRTGIHCSCSIDHTRLMGAADTLTEEVIKLREENKSLSEKLKKKIELGRLAR